MKGAVRKSCPFCLAAKKFSSTQLLTPGMMSRQFVPVWIQNFTQDDSCQQFQPIFLFEQIRGAQDQRFVDSRTDCVHFSCGLLKRALK